MRLRKEELTEVERSDAIDYETEAQGKILIHGERSERSYRRSSLVLDCPFVHTSIILKECVYKI